MNIIVAVIIVIAGLYLLEWVLLKLSALAQDKRMEAMNKECSCNSSCHLCNLEPSHVEDNYDKA